MAFQICIINLAGVTLRSGPNTSGGEIRKVKHGEVLDIERLIFAKSQTFDINYIPAFQEALLKGLVIGDVWCQVAGLQDYKSQQVTGYVALRAFSTIYGVLAGAVEPRIPPHPDNQGDREARVAEIDEMIKYLSVRRMELSG